MKRKVGSALHPEDILKVITRIHTKSFNSFEKIIPQHLREGHSQNENNKTVILF